VVTNFELGDPEWIGVLERPDAPHGPNKQISVALRFIAMPVGNTLDLNYIHDQAYNQNLSAADGYSAIKESVLGKSIWLRFWPT